MAVDPATVREMAKLARLAVPEDRIETVAGEMDRILTFMGEIARWEGDVSEDGPPTARRPDRPAPSLADDLIPSRHADESGAVIVPPIKGAS